MSPALSAKGSKLNFRKGGVNRLPAWFKQGIPDKEVLKMRQVIAEFGLRTVCQEAKCPNISCCFKDNQATFIILGDICTRNCRFCAVDKAKDKPLDIDHHEPRKISELLNLLGLRYAVITSVTRDDLIDGGASLFAQTVKLIHRRDNMAKVEVLIPDFQGKISSIKRIVDAGPDVAAHNIETVKRLYSEVRAQADYVLSLSVLAAIKKINPALITKSSLMLGLGESKEEVVVALSDLRDVDCDVVTIGQYLSPSPKHFPVKRFIPLEEFEEYRNIGLELGIRKVVSGPLVRSSYQAEAVYQDLITRNSYV